MAQLPVLSAADADSALSLVVGRTVDAVLIRDRLPDLTAVELVRLLRTDPRTLATPIVVVADAEGAGAEDDARAAGADDYVLEPLDAATLQQRVLSLAQSTRR